MGIRAKFVKNVPRDANQPIAKKSQNDEVRLYELSEPLEYADRKKCEFIAVAAINGILTGPETHIYPASKRGKILDWCELPGSFQGGMDPEEAIRRAGWEVTPENEKFLPKELVTKCFALIASHHKTVGFGNLPKVVWTRELVGLPFIWGGFELLGGIKSASRLRIACWVLGVAVLVAGVALNFWILLGLVLVIIVERKLASSERQQLMLVASLLLSVEILANNFAGWASAYPQEHMKAVASLEKCNRKSDLLDFYLPRREEIDSSILEKFGPHSDDE